MPINPLAECRYLGNGILQRLKKFWCGGYQASVGDNTAIIAAFNLSWPRQGVSDETAKIVTDDGDTKIRAFSLH